MFYIYDLTLRNIKGGVDTLSQAQAFSTNWTNVNIVESNTIIPNRYQGRWIVNEQNELENIID